MNALTKLAAKQHLTSLLTKQAGPVAGSLIGGLLGGAALPGPGGAIGAGLGAHIGKRDDRVYHGSPGLRAAGGAALGSGLGFLPLAAVLGHALATGKKNGLVLLPPALGLAALGGMIGGGIGAGSVRSTPRPVHHHHKD